MDQSTTRDRNPDEEDLGQGRAAGDRHYRAYVGPPEDFDLVAASTFSLLAILGLRQSHRLLDIGCGSMRCGRLFIPYLNRGGYTGIDPERWLVEEGVAREVGADLVRAKQPHFEFSADPTVLERLEVFDFALAQSIFTHAGPDIAQGWIAGCKKALAPHGALLATFIEGDDEPTNGWHYPGCIEYPIEFLEREAQRADLELRILDWKHPRQRWALLGNEAFDLAWLDAGPLSWNRAFQREVDRAHT